jgi:cobalt/nickel transport system permease protein
MSASFVERSIQSLRGIAERSLFSESIARSKGPLQSIDARAKLAGLLALILATVFTRDLRAVAALLIVAVLLTIVAGRGALGAVLRVWIAGALFTGIAAVGALVLTPGDAIARLPFGLAITRQGALAYAFVLGRVLTTTALSLVLVLTTRWDALLRALRMLRVPSMLIVIISMTYRYVFVLLEVAAELFDGRRSRRIGKLAPAVERRLAGAAAGALLTRTLTMTDDVYLAMQSRGFRGDVRLLDDARMHSRDWLVMIAFVAAAILVVAVSR